MIITRFEKDIIPNTPEGRAFADDYEKILKGQGAFDKRCEDTVSIVITAHYRFVLKGQEDE